MIKMAYVWVMALCMLLAIMPAVADDYTLSIFGNANMDDNIDEEDIVYVKGIINGTNEETELADANYDDEIDEEDIDQIELIISGEEKELTILDSADRIVTIPKPVEKIVVLWKNAPEEIRALGAIDRIVGIDMDTAGETGYMGGPLFFPELVDMPVVGSYDDPNYEMIIDLDPDVVIMLTTYTPLPDEVQEKLAPAGITVVGLEFYRVDIFYKELAILGYILDTEERAEEYIDFFQSWTDRIDEVVADLDPDDKKTVYYEAVAKYRTYGGAHYGSGVPEAVRTAGGIYIYDDLESEGAEVDPEDLVERNPDVIFKLANVGDGGYTLTNTSGLKEVRDEIMNRPEMSLVTAVKNDDVYVINMGISGGARKLFAPVFVAKCLYPDKFENLEPHDFIKEYLEEWQGIPYQGVYIYPYPPE
jgi:iron complex transport system substrate-binding protein